MTWDYIEDANDSLEKSGMCFFLLAWTKDGTSKLHNACNVPTKEELVRAKAGAEFLIKKLEAMELPDSSAS